MPLVKYVANLSYTDGTGSISLGPDRVLVLGGSALDVSDQEVAKLSGKFKIEVVEQGEENPVSVTKTSVFDAVAAASVSTTPADPPVSPDTPVIAGSNPGTSTPTTQLPTPPEGN